MSTYPAHCMEPSIVANIRLGRLVSFCFWLGEAPDTIEESGLLPPLFDFPFEATSSFPEPSLALTSALGNSFLPFLTASAPAASVSTTNLGSNGRLCLFYASLLHSEPDIISFFERPDPEFIPRVMQFLFLHCAYAKDKLALPNANALWTDHSSVNDEDFIKYQGKCFDLLEHVHSTCFAAQDRYHRRPVITLSSC